MKKSEKKNVAKTATIEMIAIYKIVESAMNPRRVFDEDSLRELAESIKTQGLLQPITVRPLIEGEKYEIVCGARRFRACKMAGLEDVACVVREMSDEAAFDAMITENLQRKDIDPVEEGAAFQLLVERGARRDELAARFGKSKRYVSDRIHLTDLIDDAKGLVRSGKLPITVGIALSRLDSGKQVKFLENYNTDDDDPISILAYKEFLHKMSASLDDMQWDWKNEDWHDGKKCVNCPLNTACQGSLFPELSGEARCMDESGCQVDKSRRFLLMKIEKEGDRVLREGEEAVPGKIILCSNEKSSWWIEDKTKAVVAGAQFLREKGYRVAPSQSNQEAPDTWWAWTMEPGDDTIEQWNIEDELSGFGPIRVRYWQVRKREIHPVFEEEQEDEAVKAKRELKRTEENRDSDLTTGYWDIIGESEEMKSLDESLNLWEENILIGLLLQHADPDFLMKMFETTSPDYDQVVEFKNNIRRNGWKRGVMLNMMQDCVGDSWMVSFFREAAHRIDREASKKVEEEVGKNYDAEIELLKKIVGEGELCECESDGE